MYYDLTMINMITIDSKVSKQIFKNLELTGMKVPKKQQTRIVEAV